MRSICLALVALAACATTSPAPSPPPAPPPPPAEPPPLPDQVHVVKPTELISTPGLEHDQAARAALQAAGFGEPQLSAIIAHSTEAGWPPRLATFDERMANPDILRSYRLTFVARYAAHGREGGLVIVRAAPTDNQHLAEGWRPDRDIYLVYTMEGVRLPERVAAQPAPEMPLAPGQVLIVDPGQLISNPGLDNDQLIAAGIPADQAPEIVARSQESGWPPRLASFDDRIANPPIMSGYRVTYVTRFGDSILVRAAAADNQHQPEGWRADQDIYFIILVSGLRGVPAASP